ncbi:hypothetical protein SISSUDRAFT_1058495 [Sistotremastrum suecicum HHB10207 ss-3]|uniref:Uncharacterized protein n=1 Tax=Sistotremastrum suecicum HHB10207 ss-3 TaxID=1314776 RepID=A0A166H6X5_9AGAM|nr:hypothetical protein SISSUDRAFT_1058495 [Sistotremastrum suecicum HHB10207 ss-3]
MHPYPDHIPQPPHSTGRRLEGLRPAIDPSQIPSPVEIQSFDQDKWFRESYLTCSTDQPVPLSTSEFHAIDQGNSSPRFIRASTYAIPESQELTKACRIPLGVIVQPFAQLESENPVPLIDFELSGPPRCSRCRGYINPWCAFSFGGSRWTCNMCNNENDVPQYYFSPLDETGRRLDFENRPELRIGTVDFLLPEDYWSPVPQPPIVPFYSTPGTPVTPELGSKKRPEPMDFVWIIDVSKPCLASGFTRSICSSILEALYGPVEQLSEDNKNLVNWPDGSRIAIVAFDESLSFFEFSTSSDTARMLVVADIDDVCVPHIGSLFVDPSSSRASISKLLRNLPDICGRSSSSHSSLGSAVVAGLALLSGRGGQLIVSAAQAPDIGFGKLTSRGSETSVRNTSGERHLFLPQDTKWTDLAEECVSQGVGVNLFLSFSQSGDIGTIGVLARLTGGEVFYHPHFREHRDLLVLTGQLSRLVKREAGYDCQLRLRCSDGLKVHHNLSIGLSPETDEIRLGSLDADKALGLLLTHSHKLPSTTAYMQFALLYTSKEGRRKLRVINLGLPVSSMASNIFRFADLDTCICLWARQAATDLATKNLSDIRAGITQNCVFLLLGYREQCSASTPTSQLILPEAFKCLPLYTLGLLKSKCIKGGDVAADVRNHYALKFLSCGVRETLLLCYPRLIALHRLTHGDGFINTDTKRLQMPMYTRASHLWMEGNGIYCLDNGEFLIFWIGQNVDSRLLTDIFGAQTLSSLSPDILPPPDLDTRVSKQLSNIIAHQQRLSTYPFKLLLARQNMDGTELEFSNMLVEDQNNDAMSYVDYLCYIHKQIKASMEDVVSMSKITGVKTPW